MILSKAKKVLEPLTNTQWVDFLYERLSKNYFFVILTFISSEYRHQNNSLLGHGIQAYLSQGCQMTLYLF